MRHRTILLVATALALGPSAAGYAENAATEAVERDVARYCSNVLDEARERRYALLDERLATAREQIEARRDELVARTEELAEWVERREAFVALADDTLVAIYGVMRPDTAGEQLAMLPPTVGAAVLVRLKPRQASAVLASMPRETAAELASVIAAANARVDPRGAPGSDDLPDTADDA